MTMFISGPHVGLWRCVGEPVIRSRQLHTLALLLLLLLTVQVFPQGIGSYTIFRVEERHTEYLIPDSLTDHLMHERALLLPRITRDSAIINVYANSDVKTTTFHLENNQFEPWMTGRAKSISDKKMIRVYDASGSLIFSQLHSPAYKSQLSTLKSHLSSTGADLIPDHVQLTTSLKTSLLAEGFVMTNLGGGTYRFVKDSVELYYNNSRKYNELVMKHADGTLKYAIQRDFRVNISGQTVPYIIRETYPDERFPDACIMVQQTVTYPYYSRSAGIIRSEDPEEVEELSIELYPNPATDICTVLIPEFSASGYIRVYDVLGHEVYASVITTDQTRITLDCSTWNSGIYVVEWLGDHRRSSAQLIISE